MEIEAKQPHYLSSQVNLIRQTNMKESAVWMVFGLLTYTNVLLTPRCALNICLRHKRWYIVFLSAWSDCVSLISSYKWNYYFIPAEPSPPGNIAVCQVSSESLTVHWEAPAGEVESYIVTCCSEGEIVQELTTETNKLTLNNLKPGVCYSLQVSAQLKNGRRSKPTSTSARTCK